MQPTQILPDNYRQTEQLVLKKDRRAIITISLASILILPPAAWLFFKFIYLIRPTDAPQSIHFEFNGLGETIILFASVLLVYFLMIILHEAIHGALFWFFTREKPVFAIYIYYAYAAAPKWYLPRKAYLIVGLAPLLLITLLGMAALIFAPASWFLLILFVMLSNASGSAGDLYVASWLLRQPDTLLANDQGDIFTLYLPEDGEENQE